MHIGGVDTFDHCISVNTCRRKTNKWPFNVFLFIIDAAAQNSFALFKLQNEKNIDLLRARQVQLEILSLDLIRYQVKERYETASKERFSGRKQAQIKNMETFLQNVRRFF